MSHRHFPFVVLEIEAQSLQRAASFYAAVFGWSFRASDSEPGALEAELVGDHDTLVRMRLGPRDALAGLAAPVRSAAQSDGHALCMPDLAPILAGVVAAGGQLLAGPVDLPGGGRRLSIRDTEGNALAILEPSHEGH